MPPRPTPHPTEHNVDTRTHPDSPFHPDNDAAYAAWRARKLADYPTAIESLLVDIADPARLSGDEYAAILARCRKTNMALYRCAQMDNDDRRLPAALGAQFGLTALDSNMGADDDGITTLQVRDSEWRADYIPYTDRPIHWHTDGYYNEPDRQIHGLLLHCASPAAQGGANALLDHEIAYLHLRDTDPDFIRALMQPDIMTIPANVTGGTELRPARSGPVFSINADGSLHMRYTARARNIEWSPDPLVRAAVSELTTLLRSDSPYILRATLQAGQGLICNNVLHDRAGFSDSDTRRRRLYRLRYFQRIAGT